MKSADYQKYINRLKAKRENSPYYAAFRAQQATLAERTKSVDQQLAGNMMRSGASIGASEQVAQNMIDRSRAGMGELWSQYSTKEAERRDTIDNRIDTLNMAKDEKAAEEERIRKAKKAGGWKALAQIGGTVLGAGLTLAIPGAGAALGGPVMAALSGAGIGGGVGQAVGSFIGEDGGFGINDVNPEELMQGIGDTISGISSTLTLKSQKTMMNDLTAVMPKLKDMSSDEIGIVGGLLGSGLYEQAIEYMNNYSTGEALPADIANPDDEYLRNRDAWNKTNYGSTF